MVSRLEYYHDQSAKQLVGTQTDIKLQTSECKTPILFVASYSRGRSRISEGGANIMVGWLRKATTD